MLTEMLAVPPPDASRSLAPASAGASGIGGACKCPLSSPAFHWRSRRPRSGSSSPGVSSSPLSLTTPVTSFFRRRRPFATDGTATAASQPVGAYTNVFTCHLVKVQLACSYCNDAAWLLHSTDRIGDSALITWPPSTSEPFIAPRGGGVPREGGGGSNAGNAGDEVMA